MKRSFEHVFDDEDSLPGTASAQPELIDAIIDIDPFNPYSLDANFLKDCLAQQRIETMELKERQQREWQLRCECKAAGTSRVVIVSGAYTVFDLGRTIMTSFGWEGGEFKYQSGQGHFPKKSSFARPTGEAVGDKTVKALKQLKIAEVLSPASQELVFKLSKEAKQQWEVAVRVEGVSLTRHRQPLPRCVGGQGMPPDAVAHKTWGAKSGKGKFDIDALNDELAGDRQGPNMMVPSSTPQAQVEELSRRQRRTPLFNNRGDPDVKFHGWSDFVLNSNVKRRREDGSTYGPTSVLGDLVGFRPDARIGATQA